MGWFDKLKAILNFEINSPLVNVNVTRNSDNKVNGKKYFHDEENKELLINYDELENKERENLSKVFNDNLESGGEIFERGTKCLLNDLYEYQKSKAEDKKILDFFNIIISEDDFESLEASLYLRKRFSEKKDVKGLKEGIRKRFGDRGNNIANLCTAGYFEKFLMPLYNSSKKDFEKIYEVVISKSAMAIFVHSQMEENEITTELNKKIELSKKYGLDFIHIHGIGDKNINTIKKWIEENKDLLDFLNKNIFEKEGIIIVELLL